jgi:4-hydroxybenzoate polyprenyltransferase
MNTIPRLEKSVASTNLFVLLFKQLRPKQWTKNLLLFAAPIFSISSISGLTVWINTVIGFFLFCFISGCVYILNDYVDREADRLHPEKKHRPMASGALNPQLAIAFGALLLVFSLVVGYLLEPLFALVLLVYFILNVSYSFRLKHVVILDVMVIAAGFVLRAIAGGLLIGVPFTPWFLLCILWLSLFLAISKRRHEVQLMEAKVTKGTTRKVLQSYSVDLLNQLNTIVTTATIMCYTIFTFFSNHTHNLMWTIPFVIYGIFRYLYLVHMEGKGGTPEKVLLTDRHILATVVLYAITTMSILYYLD